MGDLAIRVEHLSKRYEIGAAERGYQTIREQVVVAAKNLLRPRPKKPTIWALKDVSFDVNHGEVIGIVGRNGAGKSTLLKILSRITEPTQGRVLVYGRIGSLLEVGTGFHPELTGRENTYLNGAILGMRRHEIDRKFDEIVDFSGVEQFIDTPVKFYSSGMALRLGFAVAAHLEPEILVVDEVLAVGDAQFQKKCMGKMSDVAGQGRTVLFVSHNMVAVKSLCQHGYLLESGAVVKSGDIDSVVDYYLNEQNLNGSQCEWTNQNEAPGNEKVRMRAIRVLNAAKEVVQEAPIHEPVSIEVEYEVLQAQPVLNVSISVFSHDEVLVFSSPSIMDSEWFQRPYPSGRYVSRCRIPANFFNDGLFMVTVLLVEDGRYPIVQLDRAVSFSMVDHGVHRGDFFGTWKGVVRPLLEWQTEVMDK